MFYEFDRIMQPGGNLIEKYLLDINQIEGISQKCSPKKRFLIFFVYGGFDNTCVFTKSGKELLFKIPYSELKEMMYQLDQDDLDFDQH